MAPGTLHEPHTTNITKPSSSGMMISVPLGRSPNVVDVHLLPFPAISVRPALKAQAFDFCIDALEPFRAAYGFSELTTFLGNCTPGPCSAARSQALSYGSALRRSFYHVDNLQANSFQDTDGNIISGNLQLSKNIEDRASDISFIELTANVDPNKLAPAGTTVSAPPCTVQFHLALPQETRSPTTSAAPSFVTTLFSPRMRGVSDSSAKRTTFVGDLDLLKSQDTFNRIFPSPSFAGVYSEDTIPACERFIKECQLQVFMQLLRIDYVGTVNRTDAATVNSVRSQTPGQTEIRQSSHLHRGFNRPLGFTRFAKAGIPCEDEPSTSMRCDEAFFRHFPCP
jgi:hypothetical protein